MVAKAAVTVVNPATGATRTTTTDEEGRWVASGVESGPVRVRVDLSGFKRTETELNYDSNQPARLGVTLDAANVNETVTVTSSTDKLERENRRIEEQLIKDRAAQLSAPSANVSNLQRKVAGILPVQIDVPRAGKSHRFIRPLVLDEETRITFQYKSK